MISIHALLAESDPRRQHRRRSRHPFLSTLSLRRATSFAFCELLARLFLSTLSLRRATKARHERWKPENYFYPRSPCGERPTAWKGWPSTCYFYPRSPYGERQAPCAGWTPAARYFYPRSPCGERLAELSDIFKANQISIHALLAESDWADMQSAARKITFLSTLSLRRATIHDRLMGGPAKISIHALLAESDALLIGRFTAVADFYPRSPCGERPYAPPPCGAASVFLSTLSLRRATN